MAKTVSYLWKNMPYFSGVWFLLERYRIAFSQKNNFWQSAECVRNKLLERNTLPLVNWALSNSTGSVDRRFLFFSNFALSEHAMIISLLSPSPEEFFQATALWIFIGLLFLFGYLPRSVINLISAGLYERYEKQKSTNVALAWYWFVLKNSWHGIHLYDINYIVSDG